MVHMLVTLMNWCAYMQDYDDTIIEKHININAKVIPYENKTVVRPERREEDKHPWGYGPGNHGGAKTGCLSH